MNITFEIPLIEDLDEITQVMTRAFDDDSKKHLGKDKGGPPGYDTGDFFRKWLFQDRYSKGVKAIYKGKIIGAAIFWIGGKGDNHLGNIFVDPQFQDKGVGRQIWNYIESQDPHAKSWGLETPSFAVKNHHFYEKSCGFTKVGVKPDGQFSSFLYKKNMK